MESRVAAGVRVVRAESVERRGTSSLNWVVLSARDPGLLSPPTLSGHSRRCAIRDDREVISEISRTSLDIGRFPGTSFVLRNGWMMWKGNRYDNRGGGCGTMTMVARVGGDAMCLRRGGRVMPLHDRGVPISGVGSTAAFNCISISSRESGDFSIGVAAG